MRSSFRIAKVFGIPVELHWTFGLLIAYIVFVSFGKGGDWSAAIWNILFIAVLFICVVLHEFGHALTARRFGVGTKDIILSPIGGIARLDKLPEKPFQEFLVAIAGPAVNVAIFLLLLPYMLIKPHPGFFEGLWQSLIHGRIMLPNLDFVSTILILNLVLAVFNLLPAFPMDGGRVVRALLSIKLGRLNATKVAAYIGQAFAAFFILKSFTDGGSMFTAFIGVFIFFTAAQELRSVKVESLLQTHTVSEIMRSQFTPLLASSEIFHAVHLLRQGLEKNFLVFDENDQLTGTLERDAILKAMKANDLQSPIEKFITATPPALSPGDDLKNAYEKLFYSEHNILPVVENEAILGVVDVEMISNFLAMEQKLKRRFFK